MSNLKVLYCGDTSLQSAAAYLAGLMTRWEWEFQYVPSHEDLDQQVLQFAPQLIVLSDYPAARISAPLQNDIVQRVASGCGLLMIGGWESFHGLGGDWNGTSIGNILPVIISDTDDRRNCDGPVLLRPRTQQHPVTAGLPWDTRPPLIGGLNRIEPKPEATVLIDAARHRAEHTETGFALRSQEEFPLLIIGQHGQGRTAALATDVAPHWIGPMVDWGDQRVTARAPGAEGIEVGHLYAQFFRQLLNWASQV